MCQEVDILGNQLLIKKNYLLICDIIISTGRLFSVFVALVLVFFIVLFPVIFFVLLFGILFCEYALLLCFMLAL
jgi:hypothetical protein